MSASKSFICGVAGLTLTADERAFLEKEQPYGVILFARNIADPAQLSALTKEIKSILTHPFAAILIDQEGGRVARMRPPHWRYYPPALNLARKANGERVIYLSARLIAGELREAGITMDCAPVADILFAETHEVIGDRAFSDDPEEVAKFAGVQAQGLLDGGILPVLKHIPGHGRAKVDSHEALPVVKETFRELSKTDFIPFRRLAHLPLAMTAHIIYRALDAEHCATMSSKVVEFIRRDLSFDGLLMSDDLSMKALTGSYRERTEKTLKAGCDLVLHCNGIMEQMREVAAHSVVLAGKSLARAEKAKAALKPQTPEALAPLLTEWQQLIAA